MITCDICNKLIVKIEDCFSIEIGIWNHKEDCEEDDNLIQDLHLSCAKNFIKNIKEEAKKLIKLKGGKNK